MLRKIGEKFFAFPIAQRRFSSHNSVNPERSGILTSFGGFDAPDGWGPRPSGLVVVGDRRSLDVNQGCCARPIGTAALP